MWPAGRGSTSPAQSPCLLGPFGLSAQGRISRPHAGRAGFCGKDVFCRLQGIHPGREPGPPPSGTPAMQALPGMVQTIDVHLEGDQHFPVIQDMAFYARSYKCIHCSVRWARPSRLQRHQVTCGHASHYPYIGGPYESRFHYLLGLLEIFVAPEYQYYPYSAAFDLEACLVRPTACTGSTFTSLHMLMSVSLVSNVLGHEEPYNFISKVCPQRLVDDMLA